MLNPAHILITGASSGLGAALSRLYAGPGIRLSLQGRHTERLAQVAIAARQSGATVTTKTCDVTDAAAMAEWVVECDQTQPIGLIIANAGISAGTGFGFEKPDQAHAIFATNVQGVLNTIQPVLPLMVKRGQGQIGLMSSLASFRGMAGAAAYCASKAAIRLYGEALRSECAHRGVKVNVICPGFIKTPMTDVNRFPMPFLLGAERAAEIIQHGLATDKPRIAFPLPMYWGVRLLSLLPEKLIQFLSDRLPKKS